MAASVPPRPARVAAGATLVLLGRRLPWLNRVYDAVAQAGHEPLLYPLDLEGASPDDYAELADRLHAELGRLDGVLHCAAEFRGLTPLEHLDPAAFARAIHVNLTAPWWLLQACLPLLAPVGGCVGGAENTPWRGPGLQAALWRLRHRPAWPAGDGRHAGCRTGQATTVRGGPAARPDAHAIARARLCR